jgi:hypothetical protein
MESIKCTRCTIEKLPEEFSLDAKRKNGLNAWCKSCFSGYFQENKTDYRRRANSTLRTLKQQVLDKYGNCCACCSETHYVFLTVDHVNGDGAEHRKELRPNGKEKGSSYKLYKAVLNDPDPSRYQILCWNCNCGRQLNGGICPHKEIKDK